MLVALRTFQHLSALTQPSAFPFVTSLGDNVTALLIAIFGGAAASLAAAYFSRPKTKAEATAANATADVTMSGDAREWANFWATKAKDAQAQLLEAERRADEAEDQARQCANDFGTLKAYTLLLENVLRRDGQIPPPLPESVRLMLHGDGNEDSGEADPDGSQARV